MQLPPVIQQAYKTIHPWIYKDFHASMQTDTFPRPVAITKQVMGFDGMEYLNFCKNLYDQYNPSVLQPDGQLKIPKIIHQVWVGSPLPDAFKPLMQTWVEKHMGRGWQYKLWTDEDMKTFKLYNQKYYDETKSMGVKSDLVKWEIVYRYGGVYVDTDFECLKPLDLLHYLYDFYTGLQPLDSQFVQLGAALFAARPGHPILKHCIETIKDDWHHKGAPTKSGPVHYTKSFIKTAGKNGSKDIAFPASYCYPLECRQTDLKYKEWLEDGAYAIHHWAKSWMPIRSRPQQFQTFDNVESSKCWND